MLGATERLQKTNDRLQTGKQKLLETEVGCVIVFYWDGWKIGGRGCMGVRCIGSTIDPGKWGEARGEQHCEVVLL